MSNSKSESKSQNPISNSLAELQRIAQQLLPTLPETSAPDLKLSLAPSVALHRLRRMLQQIRPTSVSPVTVATEAKPSVPKDSKISLESLIQQLLEAMKNKDIALAVKLIQKGADVWSFSPEQAAQFLIMLEDYEAQDKRKIFEAMVARATPENVNCYIQALENNKISSLTLLHLVAQSNFADLVKKILAIKNVIVDIPIISTEAGPLTPLALTRDREVLRLLIDAGAQFWTSELSEFFMQEKFYDSNESDFWPWPVELIKSMLLKIPKDAVIKENSLGYPEELIKILKAAQRSDQDPLIMLEELRRKKEDVSQDPMDLDYSNFEQPVPISWSPRLMGNTESSTTTSVSSSTTTSLYVSSLSVSSTVSSSSSSTSSSTSDVSPSI